MTAAPLSVTEIAENAKELGAIRLDHLIRVMAEDEGYIEALPELWHAYNLADAAAKMPHNEYPEANLKAYATRAGAWFWLLARFARISEEQDFYFRGLPERKVLSVYDLQDGKFSEVQGRREFHHYVKLEDLKGLLEHIRRRHKIDIHLPWRLFEDAIGQLKTEAPPPHKYSSVPQDSIQAGIDSDHLMLLAAKGQAFTDGPKHNRMDNLSKAMKKAWGIALKEIGPKPTARNVYDCMEVRGNILEKEEADNGDPIAIHWKRSKGKEESTPYHTFENRLSRLKRTGVLPLAKSSK